MNTYSFESGHELQFPSLGHALEWAHEHNTRILRVAS